MLCDNVHIACSRVKSTLQSSVQCAGLCAGRVTSSTHCSALNATPGREWHHALFTVAKCSLSKCSLAKYGSAKFTCSLAKYNSVKFTAAKYSSAKFSAAKYSAAKHSSATGRVTDSQHCLQNMKHHEDILKSVCNDFYWKFNLQWHAIVCKGLQ